MKRIIAAGLVLFLSVSLPGVASANGWHHPRQTGWVGPHLNIHFGHKKVEYSIGLEASYWRRVTIRWDQPDQQLGVDAGIEYNFSKDKWVRYAELQVGPITLAGTSFGVVFDEDYGVGWQWSSWVNMFGGAMVRYRWYDEAVDGNEWSLGVYGKLPYLFDDDLGLPASW